MRTVSYVSKLPRIAQYKWRARVKRLDMYLHISMFEFATTSYPTVDTLQNIASPNHPTVCCQPLRCGGKPKKGGKVTTSSGLDKAQTCYRVVEFTTRIVQGTAVCLPPDLSAKRKKMNPYRMFTHNEFHQVNFVVVPQWFRGYV